MVQVYKLYLWSYKLVKKVIVLSSNNVNSVHLLMEKQNGLTSFYIYMVYNVYLMSVKHSMFGLRFSVRKKKKLLSPVLKFTNHRRWALMMQLICILESVNWLSRYQNGQIVKYNRWIRVSMVLKSTGLFIDLGSV